MATLAGKHIVAIGRSSGIGFAVARRAPPHRVVRADPALHAQERAAGSVVDLQDARAVAALFARSGTFDHRFATSGATAHTPDFRTDGLSKHKDVLVASSSKAEVDAAVARLSAEPVMQSQPPQGRLWDRFPKDGKDAMLAGYTAKQPVKHVAGPDEIAEAYLFLMKCNYITRRRIQVDGGGLLV